MIMFPQALKEFETGISFQLIDGILTFSQLQQLCSCSKKKPKPVDFIGSGYKIHLANILLVNDLSTKKDSDHVITGPVTSREHRIRVPDNKLNDVCFISYMRNCEISPMLYREHDSWQEEHVAELENLLIELLDERNFWHSITLKNLKILHNGKNKYLSLNFHYQFLLILSRQTDSLKHLSLSLVSSLLSSYEAKETQSCNKSMSYVNSFQSLLDIDQYKRKLKNILTLTVGLESLNIEAGQPRLSFIPDLSNVFLNHPNLKCLDLESVFLSIEDYEALLVLLDENYNIETIKIFIPTDDDDELQKLHFKLMHKLQLSGLERFRLQQLTQDKLITIAAEAIEKNVIDQLIFVVGPENRRQNVITNEEIFQKLCKTLPIVYRCYPHYTKICITDFKLVLWECLENDLSQTSGCFLLKKAIEAKNGSMVVHLIEAGANILEYFKVYQEETDLLALLLESNGESTLEWKTTLVEKLQQDLCLFFPAMQRLLSLEINAGFRTIQSHLNQYLQTLLKRSNWPILFKIISGIHFHFPDRKRELHKAVGRLVNAAEIVTKNKLSISCLALDELHEAVEVMVKEALSSRRGLLGQSKLNDGLVELGEKLETEIKDYKRELLYKLDNHFNMQELNQATSGSRQNVEVELNQQRALESKLLEQKIEELRVMVMHLSSKCDSGSFEKKTTVSGF